MTAQLRGASNKREASNALPDVNAETYPFDVVQKHLDQAVFANLFAVPDIENVEKSNAQDPVDWFDINGGYGLTVASVLHRFDSTIDNAGVIGQSIGEKIARLNMKLLFGSESLRWSPNAEPTPQVFDLWRSQQFASSSLEVSFGDHRSGLKGYMIGRAYPTSANGISQVLLCGVANLFEGSGNLKGFEGTLCIQGSLTAELGFQGNVNCRIVDPNEQLVAKPNSIPPLDPVKSQFEESTFNCDGATYIVMRGEKKNRTVRTEYGPSPGQGLVSLVTPAEMKNVRFPLRAQLGNRIQSDMKVGEHIAYLKATVGLDILASPGTPKAPNDFQTTNVYTFVDCKDRTIGTITAVVETGKSFDLKFPQAPGQPGMRYGGFGPIVGGTGLFEGVTGSLVVNSAIGVAPHALSMLNVLRIIDPSGKLRTHADGKCEGARRSSVRMGSGTGDRNDSPNGLLNQREKRTQTLPTAHPDINDETHPFDDVLRWLDEAAIFNMYSLPNRTSAGTIVDAQGQTIGFFVKELLHRFDVPPPHFSVRDPFGSTNSIDETLGTCSHRWLFIPDDFHALPNRQPPPTRFDPTRSQRFVMLDGLCSLRGGRNGFHGFGTGRTYPTTVGDQREIAISAVGEILEGFGQFAKTLGTYTYCGALTDDMCYRGNFLCRVADPENKFSPQRHPFVAPLAVDMIEPGVTYLVFRGQKPSNSTRTEYTLDDTGSVNGLTLFQDLRTIHLHVACNGKLETRATPGPVIGNMSANVLFNILDPGAPGTSLSPIPFVSLNRFIFTDTDGQEIGTFEVNRGEGRTFNLALPQGSRQRALRFGAFGPLVNGTGIFANVAGMMTDNSVVGIAPHATSTLYVVRLSDLSPERKANRRRSTYRTALQQGDPYSQLVEKMNNHKQQYRRWRQGFQQCADELGETIAAAFNERTAVGEFPGLSIDAKLLKQAFSSPIANFDSERFDRYQGAARASHRTYELFTHKQVGQPTSLFSMWEPTTFQVGERYLKRISGSFSAFVSPDSLPPLAGKNVDLILNGYDADVGVTSWIDIYQGGRSERASVAYSLQHKDEVLWVVKDLSRNGSQLNDDVFMVSHEWKRNVDGHNQYLMVGIFFEIDFNMCRIKLHGDTFWRELFEEE